MLGKEKSQIIHRQHETLCRYVDERGALHRESGPAYAAYYMSGAKKDVVYYKHGLKHRFGGPARIRYVNISGAIIYMHYYKDGLLHRADGPAIIAGSYKEFFINDRSLSEEEYRLYLLAKGDYETLTSMY